MPNDIPPSKWLEYWKSLLSSPTGLAEEESIESEDSEEEMGVNIHAVYNAVLERKISPLEVSERIRYGLKYHKKNGLDGVCNDLLKRRVNWLSELFVHVFNGILQLEYFPERWNKILITALYKDGDPDDPSNYRGIALLNSVGKLFVSILNKRMYSWLEETNQISEFQGGFRRKRGCTDQCFLLFCAIQTAFKENGGKVMACFVDFRKAYDTVQHKLLCSNRVFCSQ